MESLKRDCRCLKMLRYLGATTAPQAETQTPKAAPLVTRSARLSSRKRRRDQQRALAIDVFGDTAIATCSYEIAYEMGGERFNDTGRDIFVFVRENHRSLAVWRTMIIPEAKSVN
jgi:hypothetical protein